MQGVDPAAVVGRYIDEFHDHFPFDPELPAGRDGLVATIRLLRSAFSALRLSIEDMVLEDDRVVVRFALKGMHSGPFAGHVPTGRPVLIPGTVIYRVQDHQIIDQWCLFDAFGLLRQLRATEPVLATH